MALSKLINKLQAGKSIVTGFGLISFNDQGEASVELETATKLCELKGFSMEDSDVVETHTEEVEVEEPVEAIPVEEVVEPEEEVEEDGITEEELNKLTAAQLKKIAMDNDINVKNLTRRDQFISAIMNA